VITVHVEAAALPPWLNIFDGHFDGSSLYILFCYSISTAAVRFGSQPRMFCDTDLSERSGGADENG